jgi:long-chain acyl-CoA synthetase
MSGYLNLPEESARTLRDGWVRTGDAGRMDEQGYVFIADRLKDMIITGGENVYSAEVENALSSHPDVQMCAVIGVPDDRWGERIHAVITRRPGAGVTEEALILHCRSLIAGYKTPRSIELRDDPLPLTAAGKIQKNELRQPHWQGRVRAVN